MVDMNEPIGLVEPEVLTLKHIEEELALDVDGVRTLIAEINKSGRVAVDKEYLDRIIKTINESLTSHMYKLNEVGKSIKEPTCGDAKLPSEQ